MKLGKELIVSLKEMVYPQDCKICASKLLNGETGICLPCYGELPRTRFVLGSGNPVERIFYGRVRLGMASSFLLFSNNNATRKLIHQIKYQGNAELSEELGRIYASELVEQESFAGADIFLPVPLHKKREKQRGYNQSAAFARGMAEILGAVVNEQVLSRTSNNESQTRKQRFDRWLNAENRFAASKQEMLEGKRVFVVDDVVTTGATLESCIRTLEEAKPALLGVLTLAAAS